MANSRYPIEMYFQLKNIKERAATLDSREEVIVRQNKIGHFFKHLFMAGVIMASALSIGHTASAASRIPVDNITVDYASQTLEVITTDNELMVAFPTVKIAGDEITEIKIKKWDIYDYEYMQERDDETNLVTVDLSPINSTKGGYVAIKTDATSEAYLIHFGAVHTKLSASYDPSEKIVSIIDKADNYNECEGMFEYRTQYGNWVDYNQDEANFQHYEQQGATLYFREKCGYDDGDEYVSKGILSKGSIAEKVGPVDIDPSFVLYEALNTFSGKELKVKITKLREGPTASMNYAKRTITVKKNCEYRTNAALGFKKTVDGKAMAVGIGNDAGILEVRTAAVSTAKKYTPPSKITRYEYPATRTLTVTADEDGYVGGKAGKFSMTYNEKTKKIECISTDRDNTYLVYVRKAGKSVPVAGDSVLTTVRPTNSDSVPKVVTLSASKIPSGSEVYVAYAADIKNKKWATEPVLLGKAK